MDHWLAVMDKDGRSRSMLPMEPLLFHSFNVHMISKVSSFVDNTIQHSKRFDEAFCNVCKFAGSLRIFFTNPSSSLHLSQDESRNHQSSTSGDCSYADLSLWASSSFIFTTRLMKSTHPISFSKISTFMMGLLHRKSERLRSLSLASTFIPSFNKRSLTENPSRSNLDQTRTQVDQGPCEVRNPECRGCTFSDLTKITTAIEPRTGIEFPMVLGNILYEKNKLNVSPEVLVGTGSRIMKIIRIKSLQVYAFGFYVHPSSVCEKLSPKYVSRATDLDKSHEFFQDILREDIGMTVRLVINCNGVKIGAVRDAFEKSLRARLLKTNPDTNFDCLKTFGSFFTNDISISAGTTVEFRRTSDGKLITEVEGQQIGAVHSKDLCTAFFGMYIGEGPVCEQTKEEIGRNIGNIIRRC